MHTSVIVVSYNSARHLAACLDSILAQLGPQDELIVVDNNSGDRSAELVQSRYPQVCLIRSANNGYAGGNNRGAAVARGDYLVFLNPDTCLAAGALSALVAPLQDTPDTALTTACIVYMQRPDLVNACGNTIHYTGLTYCRGAGRPKADYSVSCEVDAVSGAAFAIRRSVFEELGGFDPQFFMYVEDTDLSWRARLAGYRCRYVAEALVEHAYVPAYSPLKAFYVERNRHLMLLKNLSRASYARVLPGLLIGELVTWGFLLMKGPRYWGIKLRVYRALWQARSAPQGPAAGSDILKGMTYRLEFEQLADRRLAQAAALIFHPVFWLARLLFARGSV